jgi:molecular chaperone DnaJ
MAKKDYYKTLGVKKSADQKEIKKAFKKVARECHPDLNKGDKSCEENFKEVSEAYQVLSDSKKRKEYDMFGRVGGSQTSWGGDPGWSGAGGHGVNFEDIFGRASSGGFSGGNSSGGIGDLFSDMFGGSARRSPRGGTSDYDTGPQPGRDVELELTISFEEAIEGGTHRFTIRRNGQCPTCRGTGKKQNGNIKDCTACHGTGKRNVANVGANINMVCSACHGSGKVYLEECDNCGGSGKKIGPETLSVKVPPGVKDGGRLRLANKGEIGDNGIAGNMYLRIKVKPHKYFTREGDNLHINMPITFTEAALGAKVDVPTLNGTATMKIPAGTQNGAVLRLKNKGAPKGAGNGDLHVHIVVDVPKKPDKDIKKLLEKLKALEKDPRKNKFT